jgi:hypothetical protein
MSGERRGQAVLVVEIEVAEADVDQLNRWYDDKHVPERLAMAGFVSARRYASTDKPGRFLAVYELEGPEAALSDEYMEAARSLETEWDRAVHATWLHMHREVWTSLDEPAAGEP